MKRETETMSLDEINRALDLARERDPSLEPEPWYSDGFQSQLVLSTADHATNLSANRKWVYDETSDSNASNQTL